jgi:hypothetical protein
MTVIKVLSGVGEKERGRGKENVLRNLCFARVMQKIPQTLNPSAMVFCG